MKVYLVYEFIDYGLWDMEKSKIFSTLEKAEAYSNSFVETYGYALDISEMEIE